MKTFKEFILDSNLHYFMKHEDFFFMFNYNYKKEYIISENFLLLFFNQHNKICQNYKYLKSKFKKILDLHNLPYYQLSYNDIYDNYYNLPTETTLNYQSFLIQICHEIKNFNNRSLSRKSWIIINSSTFDFLINQYSNNNLLSFYTYDIDKLLSFYTSYLLSFRLSNPTLSIEDVNSVIDLEFHKN